MDLDSIRVKRLDMIQWIDSLNMDKIFSSDEIFAFQLLMINFFFNIETTLQRKSTKAEPILE